MISDEGRTAHRVGQVRQFLKQLTCNSNQHSQVHAPVTRVRPKASFNQAVLGEDDQVPGDLLGLGGSWTTLVMNGCDLKLKKKKLLISNIKYRK